MTRYAPNPYSDQNYTAGGDVLRLLASASGAVQAQGGECAQELDRLERAVQDDLRSRGEQLMKLAQHYLPDVSQETVADSFAEVRGDLESVLLRKERREEELHAEWDRGLDQRQRMLIELDEVTAELDGLVHGRERLEQQLAGVLEGDELFQQLSRQALRAEQELERNLARVEESKQEAADKLPAYEKSRLFKYLVDRKFGTPDYKKRGLARRLDRWVARIVNYEKARESYNFLRVTPELMAAEVDRRRAEFERLMEEIEEIEQKHSTEIGLTDVLKRGMKAGKRRDALLTKIEAEQAEQDAIEQELETLTGAGNEFHQQAVARMQRFLGGLEESALEAKTRGTAGTTDDMIFAEIQWLNDRVEEAGGRAGELRRHRLTLQRQQADLSDLARRFQIAEFDSRRSVFPAGFDPRPDIENFLKGIISKETVWQAIKRHQRFLPTWVEERAPSRDLLDREFSYLLVRVLAEAAGVALRHAADNHRRNSSRRIGKSPSVRRRARGGFTSGRGF